MDCPMIVGISEGARAEALIDLDAIRANVAQVRRTTSADVMAVVKADAYGHGLIQIAQTLRGEDVTWLGVALPSEALALRDSGDAGRILAWLTVPGDPDIRGSVAAEIDLGVSMPWLLDEIAELSRARGVAASVHLKVDTGLGRGGSTSSEWPSLIYRARQLQSEGVIRVAGVWSHLAAGEDLDHPSIPDQVANFTQATTAVGEAGLHSALRHLANSGAVLSGAARRFGIDFELVRSGIAIYGITPGVDLGSSRDLRLTPAMTLAARLAQIKQVPSGHGVSYGHTWRAPRDTNLGLVPVGYADGLPRTAEHAEVSIARGDGWQRYPVVGRIAMDQCVVDLGIGPLPSVGAPVLIFGTGDHGEPTAEDWAQWAGTIGYEIVTRIGERIPRRYVSSEQAEHGREKESP
jgi:alanine racemase